MPIDRTDRVKFAPCACEPEREEWEVVNRVCTQTVTDDDELVELTYRCQTCETTQTYRFGMEVA